MVGKQPPLFPAGSSDDPYREGQLLRCTVDPGLGTAAGCQAKGESVLWKGHSWEDPLGVMCSEATWWSRMPAR